MVVSLVQHICMMMMSSRHLWDSSRTATVFMLIQRKKLKLGEHLLEKLSKVINFSCHLKKNKTKTVQANLAYNFGSTWTFSSFQTRTSKQVNKKVTEAQDSEPVCKCLCVCVQYEISTDLYPLRIEKSLKDSENWLFFLLRNQ